MSYKRPSHKFGFWYPCINTSSMFLGLLIPTVGLLGLNTAPSLAQLTTAQINSTADVKPQAKVLYINPTAGNDNNADGSERSPFKTITKALRQSQANTVILLSLGTYSSDTGEVFPLILKPGVTLQGDPRTRGQDIIIQGGGAFISRTAAEQNVAVVGANQATITGVTISNPSFRGYGLWIESSSPVVIDNTFKGSSHDGVSVNGNSSPLIRSNYFYDNHGNGITIYGTSQPEVKDNVFFKTGFGISVTQDAAPKLIGNRVTLNKDGVVVEGSAQPILRNNIISNNERDGLVAISQSRPDLGTPSEPGGNIFRDNGQLDISNKAANQVIPAFGNQVSRRTAGKIDLAGNTTNAQGTSGEQRQNSSVSASSFPVPTSLNSQSPTGTNQPSTYRSVTWEASNVGGTSSNIGKTTETLPPPPVSNRKTNLVDISLDASNSVSQPQSVDFAAPSGQVATRPINRASTLPVLNSNPIARQGDNGDLELLPVPTTNIPLGNINKGKPTPASNFNQPLPSQAPVNYSRPAFQGRGYRVVIEAFNSADESLARSLAPDAFHTSIKGKKMLQVGLYSDQGLAEQTLATFRSKGLRGAILPLN